MKKKLKKPKAPLKTPILPQESYDYATIHSSIQNPFLDELYAETNKQILGGMQMPPHQGQFMYLLIKLLSAKRILEVGTYTGYSALFFALALPPDGQLITCDIREDWVNVGKPYWQKAEVAHKINAVIAPAEETLDKLIGQKEIFDLAFVDADKSNYNTYYEQCLKLVKPGGLICLDNVLWRGKVLEKNATNKRIVAIKEINEKVKNDTRVESCLLPYVDGITFARVKSETLLKCRSVFQN